MQVYYKLRWSISKSGKKQRHHKIQRTHSRQELVRQEIKLTAAADPLPSKRAKVVDIRQNRQHFLESQKPRSVQSQREHFTQDASLPVDKSKKMRALFESTRDGEN
jgi:uncharacterized FlgJ-related protein